jgi:diguanylate cyclase (GGDEF)-like protein/PAS domain S-box-containing protein
MADNPTKAAKGQQVAHAYAMRLLQHLVVPTFVIDAQRRVVVWNRACERLTGVAAAEVLGTSKHWQAFYENRRYCLADLVALGRHDKIGELYTEYVETRDESLGSSAENWCVMPRLGNHLYLAIDAGPIHDDDGNLIAVVETLRDMTDQKRAEMTLQNLATKDSLTGLANRRSLDEKLQLEWKCNQRCKSSLAFILADVDHFKNYNDHYGHQKGDDCLRAVAGAIGATVFRPADMTARYGGEEFAVVMPNTDLAGAKAVAERIREAIVNLALPHCASPTAPHVTLSMGVSVTVPDAGSSVESLIAAADAALYQAKHAGRNRVGLAEPPAG